MNSQHHSKDEDPALVEIDRTHNNESGEELKPLEKCSICWEPARLKCGHCELPYCEIHYGMTVMTGNCCRGNEKDYE